MTGDSTILDPWANELAAAPSNEETIITTTGSLELVLEAKSMSDVGGHYSRPDVLQLHLNDSPAARMVRSSNGPARGTLDSVEGPSDGGVVASD